MANTDTTLQQIDHIVVIYLENRSFDNLYGLFPGANGIQNLKPSQYLQIDNNGQVLTRLPPVRKTGKEYYLSNHPFSLQAAPYYLSLNDKTADLVHDFYLSQGQINQGKNNRFVAISNAGALTMGYYDGSAMKIWQLARQYTLADNFFMGAFGGSFLNHFWIACACTPRFVNAPKNKIVVLNADGISLKRKPSSPASVLQGPPKWVHIGSVTPDFFVINTIQPAYQPSNILPAVNQDPRFADLSKFPLPPQTATTIGDELSAKGISWVWYSEGFDQAVAGSQQTDKAKRKMLMRNFQINHQPYNYFKNYAPGTQARAEHLQDARNFYLAIHQGKIPSVVFYKPENKYDQHPGSSDIMLADQHIADLIARIQQSPQWPHTLIIVTYDENGGFWDHVPPPIGDRWGPGTRVPTILISPLVKKGFIDHTQYDTTSILKLISKRFDLKPLPGLRQNMGDLTNALQ